MKWDSPFVLALGGTLAFHLIAITVADILVVTHPYIPPEVAPHIEMVDLDVPPPPPPPPPPPALPDPPPLPDPAPTPPPPPTTARVATREPAPEAPRTPAPTAPPDPTTPPVPTSPTAPGGEQVVQLADLAPTRDGVAVGRGTPHDRIGRGGTGGGTGSGAGSGSGGDAPAPAPTSIAQIKTPAKPRGDYGYFDAGRDYPPEARQLGIQGVIRVKLVVDAQGKVTSAKLLTTLGHGLDELALARARTIEFTPAVDTDDRPTGSLVIWTFHMTLPK